MWCGGVDYVVVSGRRLCSGVVGAAAVWCRGVDYVVVWGGDWNGMVAVAGIKCALLFSL